MVRLVALLVVLVALAVPQTASAATCDFTGTSGDPWNVAGNWSCNEIPDTGDAVTITTKSVTVSAPAGAASLVMTNSATVRFTSASTLGVTGAMTVSGVGTISGAGSLSVGGTFLKTQPGQLAVTGDGTFGESADLVLNGPGSIDGGSLCVADTGDGNPDLPNLHINDDFVIATGADANVVGCSAGPQIHVNAPDGHLIKASPGTTQSFSGVDNDATITVQAGQLTLTGGAGAAISDGDFVADFGATLQFANAYTVGPTGRVGGLGTIHANTVTFVLQAGAILDPAVLDLTFGALTLDGTTATTLSTVNLGNAALDTDRPVTITTLNTTGGIIQGNGSVTVPAGGSFTKTGPALLTVTNSGAQGAADLILNVDATLEGGGMCVARNGDQDPDQPNLHLNRQFTIGAGAATFVFACGGVTPFIHVNGPSGHLLRTSGNLTAQNAIEIAGGTVTVASGQTWELQNGLQVNSGVLRGTGTIAGNVTNSGGTVQPGASPGVLTVTGNYVQGLGGTLETEIVNATPGTGFDRLVVGGTAQLAGTLAIVNSYDPLPTDTFEILTATAVSGTFDPVTGASLGGESYVAQYNPDDVTLTVVPGPVNSGAPSISGTPAVASTLTCNTGDWTGSPTFTFEWLNGGTPIAGATSQTYVVQSGDAGDQISCRVTATNGAGSGSVTSPVVTIATPQVTPTPTPTPSPTPTPTPTVTPPVTLPAAPSAVAQVFGLPSARKCLSRRRFPIRLREPKGLELKSGTIKVPGRKAVRARRRNGRLTAIVDLRGLPKRTVVVTLKVVLRDGRKATGRRTYRTCVPKRG